MDPFAFPTGLLDRRDPAVALQLVSTLVAVTVRSESYDQARHQRRTGPRQTSKETPVRVAAHELVNTPFENRDLAAQSRQQRHQAASDDGPRFQYRSIRGGGYSLVDGLEALLHAFPHGQNTRRSCRSAMMYSSNEEGAPLGSAARVCDRARQP